MEGPPNKPSGSGFIESVVGWVLLVLGGLVVCWVVGIAVAYVADHTIHTNWIGYQQEHRPGQTSDHLRYIGIGAAALAVAAIVSFVGGLIRDELEQYQRFRAQRRAARQREDDRPGQR